MSPLQFGTTSEAAVSLPFPVPVPARKAFSPNRGPPSPIPIPSVNLQHAPCSLDGLLGGTCQPALRTMHASHHITHHRRQNALPVQEEANFLMTVCRSFPPPTAFPTSPSHHLTSSPPTQPLSFLPHLHSAHRPSDCWVPPWPAPATTGQSTTRRRRITHSRPTSHLKVGLRGTAGPLCLLGKDQPR